MILGAAKVRWTVLAGLVGLLAAARASAQTAPCVVDSDCPGNAACGGDVCYKSSGGAQCVPANTMGLSGTNDGWCVDSSGNPSDTACKCHALGAVCNGINCSFTVPPDGGTTGTGGATGTGGSGAGGKGGSGTGGAAAGTNGGGGGGGGCSLAGDPSVLEGASALAVLLGSLLTRRRRGR